MRSKLTRTKRLNNKPYQEASMDLNPFAKMQAAGPCINAADHGIVCGNSATRYARIMSDIVFK